MKRGFGTWRCVAILLTLNACGTNDLLGPDAAQGIEGIVLLGPQCPVQTVDVWAEVIVNFDTGIR